MRTQEQPDRTISRSALAIGAGVVINVVAALGLDQLFHALEVYPPWDEPMVDPAHNALALGYRILIAISAAYVTARLAPRAPLRHALILGGIGLVASFLGMVAALNVNLGPIWYPIALVAVSLPCAWIGGRLAVRTPELDDRRRAEARCSGLPKRRLYALQMFRCAAKTSRRNSTCR